MGCLFSVQFGIVSIGSVSSHYKCINRNYFSVFCFTSHSFIFAIYELAF